MFIFMLPFLQFKSELCIMYHQQHPPITDFVVIEFPGVVRSLDKALETMGGLDSISTVSVN
jgi:hypothetical protein